LPVILAGMDGKTIRRERKRRGWSQRDLAARIGVGPRTVGAWERGENSADGGHDLLRDLFASVPPKVVENDAAAVRPLDAYSDAVLLGELMRRAVDREEPSPSK